jgi:hypothetical protein
VKKEMERMERMERQQDSEVWMDAYKAYKAGTPISRCAKEFGIGEVRLGEYIALTDYIEGLR